MTREFILIPSFIVKWKNLGLTDEERNNLKKAVEILELSLEKSERSSRK